MELGRRRMDSCYWTAVPATGVRNFRAIDAFQLGPGEGGADPAPLPKLSHTMKSHTRNRQTVRLA
jgi:hypothetical protein